MSEPICERVIVGEHVRAGALLFIGEDGKTREVRGAEWHSARPRPCFHLWLRAGSDDAGPRFWCPFCKAVRTKSGPFGFVWEEAAVLAGGPVFHPTPHPLLVSLFRQIDRDEERWAHERGAGAPLVHPATVPAPRSTL